ncbi:hypothetical protein Dimus_003264 [Dionaea muscipula]
MSPTGHGEVFIEQTLRKKKTVSTLPGAAISADSFTYRRWIMHGRAVSSSLGTVAMKLLQMLTATCIYSSWAHFADVKKQTWNTSPSGLLSS